MLFWMMSVPKQHPLKLKSGICVCVTYFTDFLHDSYTCFNSGRVHPRTKLVARFLLSNFSKYAQYILDILQCTQRCQTTTKIEEIHNL